MHFNLAAGSVRELQSPALRHLRTGQTKGQRVVTIKGQTKETDSKVYRQESNAFYRTMSKV